MLASIRAASGRLAVVLPHGVLFRGGVEGEVRRNIIEAGVLDAVIGLAPNLFYNTTIPAAVLVCRAAGSVRRDGVLFIDASARFRKGRNQNELTELDVQELVAAYATGEEASDMNVRRVPIAEIEEADWDLSIGRYLTVEAESQMELSVAVAAFADARGALRAAEEDVARALSEAGWDA